MLFLLCEFIILSHSKSVLADRKFLIAIQNIQFSLNYVNNVVAKVRAALTLLWPVCPDCRLPPVYSHPSNLRFPGLVCARFRDGLPSTGCATVAYTHNARNSTISTDLHVESLHTRKPVFYGSLRPTMCNRQTGLACHEISSLWLPLLDHTQHPT